MLKAVQKNDGISVQDLGKLLPKDKDAQDLVSQLVKDKLIILEKEGVCLPK